MHERQRQLKWTRTPPAKRGYYWFLAETWADPQVVRVGRYFADMSAGELVLFADFTTDIPAERVKTMGGFWAGPIPVPPIWSSELQKLESEGS